MYKTLKDDLIAQKVKNANVFKMIVAAFLNQSFQLVFLYRISRRFDTIPFVGKVLCLFASYFSRVITGCHISPRAKIGAGVYFPHPTGIVIGEDVVIKQSATVYQNVTIGRRSFYADGYPVIEEYATIYSGAVVIGPIRVGKRSVVGANVVVKKDVPENTILSQSSLYSKVK